MPDATGHSAEAIGPHGDPRRHLRTAAGHSLRSCPLRPGLGASPLPDGPILFAGGFIVVAEIVAGGCHVQRTLPRAVSRRAVWGYCDATSHATRRHDGKRYSDL